VTSNVLHVFHGALFSLSYSLLLTILSMKLFSNWFSGVALFSAKIFRECPGFHSFYQSCTSHTSALLQGQPIPSAQNGQFDIELCNHCQIPRDLGRVASHRFEYVPSTLRGFVIKSSPISVIAALISGSFVLKARRASQAVENKRVAELVQIALDTLRNQELAHHTDPVTAPQPYLSSLQLRDLILQDEHSISTRRRLWDQVERVVEGNANVRANLQEVYGGDELRVWRWIGGAGRSPGMRKRVQFENRGD
jgi:hypothetical protein